MRLSVTQSSIWYSYPLPLTSDWLILAISQSTVVNLLTNMQMSKYLFFNLVWRVSLSDKCHKSSSSVSFTIHHSDCHLSSLCQKWLVEWYACLRRSDTAPHRNPSAFSDPHFRICHVPYRENDPLRLLTSKLLLWKNQELLPTRLILMPTLSWCFLLMAAIFRWNAFSLNDKMFLNIKNSFANLI